MRNIVLTGFMGAGKTSVARELSQRLGMKIVDMDTEIEKEQGMTISEIFAQYGEAHFREMETEMARKVSQLDRVIISTGGGVVLKKENMDYLRKGGVIVCLTASPEVILQRTRSTDDRPLLNVGSRLEKIRDLLEYRMPFYRNADIMIDTVDKTPRQVAEAIVKELGWKR